MATAKQHIGEVRKWGVEIISYLFILLFVYAAVSKLMDMHQFYNDLRNSPVFGGEIITRIISWAVPITELAVAFVMALPQTRLRGLYASFILMLAFSLYIAGILLFSNHIPCSCGGIIAKLTWQQHLIFNLVFALLAMEGIYLYPKKKRAFNGSTKNKPARIKK